MTSPLRDPRLLGAAFHGGGLRPSRARRRRLQRGSDGAVLRRPLVPRPVVAVLAVTLLALGYLAVVASGGGDDAGSSGVSERPGAAEQADGAERQARAGAQAPVFASVGADEQGAALELVLPHPAPLAVAFHEATRAEALTLAPVGTLQRNDNPTAYEPVPDDPDGVGYHVAPSLGRARSATSAVEVAVSDGATVLAPVTGTVVEVRQYPTSAGPRDWRVVVEPASRPDLHVVIAHLTVPQVAVGARVQAGDSPVAVARQVPYPPYLDRVLDGAYPSVLVEVKPAGAAEPLDPNAPALPREAG